MTLGSAELDDFQAKVDSQGAAVRDLKASGGDVAEAVKELLALKASFLAAVTAAVDTCKDEQLLAKLKEKQAELTPQSKKKKKKKQQAPAPAPAKKKDGELSKKEKNKLEKKLNRQKAKEKMKAGGEAPKPAGKGDKGNKKGDAPTVVEPAKKPFTAMLVAKVIGTEVKVSKSNNVTDKKGKELQGVYAPLKYISNVYGEKLSLCGKTNDEIYEVDLWLEQTASIKSSLQLLETHLSTRTYIVGYALTLADLSVYCELNSDSKMKGMMKQFKNVLRWNQLIGGLPEVEAFSKEHFVQEVKNTKGGSGKQAAVCPPLPGVKEGDNVVTRFPPEPSGHLHIGHTKALFLNQYYAKRYNGKMLLRFDDTNPSKEKEEYEHGILEDMKSLNVVPYKVSWTSDHFERIKKDAIKLIKSGDAYMDDTPADRMKCERDEGIDSKNRSNTPEQNMKLWEEMLKGSTEGTKWCLRAKMDMQSLNKCLRDPVFYRCNLLPHARTKTKYKAYPTYDLACPIVDSIEGVTHAMRDMNYRDRKPLYEWVIAKLNLRPVILHDFSRLNFVNVLLSKRKLGWFVDEGRVEAWDDPRFPTIKGMLRRGLQVEALFDFMVAQGASRKDSDMEWDKFWNLNKKVIDPVVPRYMGVDSSAFVPIVLEDVSSLEAKTIPKHPKDATGEKFGMKTLFISPTVICEQGDVDGVVAGEELLLLQLGCVTVVSVETTKEGRVSSIVGKRNPTGDVKKPKRKIHWLPQVEHLVKAKVFEFDYLITKKKLDEADDFKDFLNPNTIATTSILASPGLRTLQKGDCCQLLRRGYFIVDKVYNGKDSEVHLFTIPDGKAKSISTFQSASGKMQHR